METLVGSYSEQRNYYRLQHVAHLMLRATEGELIPASRLFGGFDFFLAACLIALLVGLVVLVPCWGCLCLSFVSSSVSLPLCPFTPSPSSFLLPCACVSDVEDAGPPSEAIVPPISVNVAHTLIAALCPRDVGSAYTAFRTLESAGVRVWYGDGDCSGLLFACWCGGLRLCGLRAPCTL